MLPEGKIRGFALMHDVNHNKMTYRTSPTIDTSRKTLQWALLSVCRSQISCTVQKGEKKKLTPANKSDGNLASIKERGYQGEGRYSELQNVEVENIEPVE